MLPNPSTISEICFSVVPGITIPDWGSTFYAIIFTLVALYSSFDGGSTWSILGTVTTTIPRQVAIDFYNI